MPYAHHAPSVPPCPIRIGPIGPIRPISPISPLGRVTPVRAKTARRKKPFKRAAPAREPVAAAFAAPDAQWRLHHEAFAAALAARLSLFLRADFTLALAGIQLLPYQRMTESWPDPAHLTLFKTEPLRGVSILQIPTPLGLCHRGPLDGRLRPARPGPPGNGRD